MLFIFIKQHLAPIMPIEKKQYELLQFSGIEKNNVITIFLTSNGGKFPGRPTSREIIFTIPGQQKAPSAVLINGKTTKQFSYDKENTTLQVNTTFTAQPLKIEIRK